MKLAVAALLCVASGTEVIKHKRGHSAVEEVVDMLKDMLKKSKEDGEAAKEAFEKFKEYCDENNKEKSEDIEENTKDIKLLSAKIERLQGENGELSVEVGRLHKDIAENEQQREEAESIRTKAHEAFLAEEEDLENAIDQMKEALETLSEVGSDQTMGSAEDHEKMMAGFESAAFLAKQSTTEKLAKRVHTALLAAGSFLTPAQKTKVDSFLQTKSPFTGSYSAQSGQVVGILKNMRDTFKSNLEEARNREEKEKEAFDELMETLTDKYDKMKEAFDEKQETLGTNDGTLSDKKDALREAKNTVADAEEFLSKLLPLCDEKEKEYNLRELELRPKEEKAITKAVEIIEREMDSFDDIADQKNAFMQKHKAGKGLKMVKQRKVASFLQLSSSSDVKTLEAAVRILGSTKRSRPLALLLKGGNPFDTVLSGIDKMLKVIVREGKVDKERKDWCNDERDEKTENLDDKIDDIGTLEADIESLDETIDDPETGLKEQIKQAEEDWDTCRENMKEETEMRREDNAAYQKDIDTMVQGEEAIKKAREVLDKFYKALEEHNDGDDDAFMQFHKGKKEDPDAPEIMEEDFEGQSDKGGEVLDLLKEIYDNLRAQEARCHQDEEAAQHDYEDSMTDLKDEENDLRESIIKLTKDLKDAEKNHESKHKELTKTEKEKMKLEQYLDKIKPGCDFVVDNFDERESNRETESEALEKAKELLEDSPMFKQAQQAQKEKAMGDCKDTCLEEGDGHAKCKACLAGVSVPGYCVDHGDAEGC